MSAVRLRRSASLPKYTDVLIDGEVAGFLVRDKRGWMPWLYNPRGNLRLAAEPCRTRREAVEEIEIHRSTVPSLPRGRD